MIEIFASLLQFVIFIIFFFFFHKFFNKNLFYLNSNTVFQTFSINIIIFLNILLFFSFLNINSNIVYYFILILSFFNLKNFNFFKKELTILYFFFLINIIFFINIIHNPILGWDGQVVWYPKVYNFFSGGNFFTLADSHYPEYPHLGSFLWFFFWKNSFLQLEYFGRFIYVFIYSVSIFLYFGIKGKNYKNILILFFMIFLTYDKDLFTGYQEVLIFSLINIFMYFYIALKKKNFFFLILSILICNSVIWIKSEGIFFIIPIIFLFIVSLSIDKIYKKIFLFFIILILIIRVCLSVEMMGDFRWQGEGYSANSLLIQLLKYDLYLNKASLILKHFIISFFKYPIWLLTFILLFVRYLNLKEISYKNFIVVVVYLLFFNFAVFFTSSANLEWHLAVALDRLNYIASAYLFFFVYIKLTEIKYGNYDI